MPTCQWSLNHELYFKRKLDPGIKLKATNWLLCLHICGGSFFLLLMENVTMSSLLSTADECLQAERLLLSQKCLHLLLMLAVGITHTLSLQNTLFYTTFQCHISKIQRKELKRSSFPLLEIVSEENSCPINCRSCCMWINSSDYSNCNK